MMAKTKGLPQNQSNANQALKQTLLHSLDYKESDIDQIVDRAVSPNSSVLSESRGDDSAKKLKKDDSSNASSSYSLRAQKRKELQDAQRQQNYNSISGSDKKQSMSFATLPAPEKDISVPKTSKALGVKLANLMKATKSSQLRN